jgi:uncharacterized repeat protein (TIGR01451 family)
MNAGRRKQFRRVINAFLAFLLVLPLTATGAELSLGMEGPKLVREGDLIEYQLTLVNEGSVAIDNIEVLDRLPAGTDFVDATPLPFGTYDSLTGIWTIPTLGTSEKDRTASLALQGLVHTNLLADSDDVEKLVNRAEVTAPRLSPAEKATITSRVICPFCNDWEMLSPKIRTRLSSDGYSYDGIRFVIDVYVANNGPVRSDATVRAKYFSVSGGGLGKVKLKPYSPVEITLKAGESRRVRFLTTWEDLPESNYWLTATFEVNDVALHDPISPNVVTATWKGEVDGDGSSGSSGGCTLNTKNGVDPLWLLLVLLPFMRLTRRDP